MADAVDLHTLAWRLGKLEDAQDRQAQDFARQLAEHRNATDAIISGVRKTMSTDYLTKDQTENAFLTKRDAIRDGVVRREWLLLVVGLTSLASVLLQVFHH